MAKVVWIESMGCPKNEVDGERIENLLSQRGYSITEDQSRADILILNTCGFIQPAKEESIGELFRLVKLKNEDGKKKIILCGCLAQRYPKELWRKLPELDALLGVNGIEEVDRVCRSVLQGKKVFRVNPPERGNGVGRMKRQPQRHPFAYIKIADGCDNWCSYCAIPGIRGRFRSKRIKDVLDEAGQLAGKGVKEIDLVAQDTTLYGVDLYGEKRLPQLLSSLSRIPKLRWIRLLYTHPAHFSDRLIDELASNPKVCKYVDLPLQHISDEILKRMNRKVTRKKVEHLILKLRERVPDLTLRTSFIVGFPGETKSHFEELLRFAEETRFDKLGAFSYSKEEGTEAFNFKGQISSKLKQERLDQLMLTQQRIAFEKNEAKVGKTLTVVIDGASKEPHGYLVARSQSEAPEVDAAILVRGSCARAGELAEVKIVAYRDYDLIGEQLRKT